MYSSIRWGLCCQFLDSDIKFRSATHRYVHTLDPVQRQSYLGQLAMDNAAALVAAVERCSELGIGAFRINSQILPLATHPVSGYRLEEIDPENVARDLFIAAGKRARQQDIRLSFHPDQFVVLNSARPEVVAASIEELEYQAFMAQLVRADTIVLHAGSTVGGIPAALERLEAGIERLSPAARSRLGLENDDRSYAPANLLPLCRRLKVPLVYDVHHHRCLPDALTIEEATAMMLSTWIGREPYAHISSPRNRAENDRRPHAAFVDPADFPDVWADLRITVDVEAKEKERAVLTLKRSLSPSANPNAHRVRKTPGNSRKVHF